MSEFSKFRICSIYSQRKVETREEEQVFKNFRVSKIKNASKHKKGELNFIKVIQILKKVCNRLTRRV